MGYVWDFLTYDYGYFGNVGLNANSKVQTLIPFKTDCLPSYILLSGREPECWYIYRRPRHTNNDISL